MLHIVISLEPRGEDLLAHPSECQAIRGLGFLDIPKLIEGAMEAHKEDFKVQDVTLDDILGCDAWAREYVAQNTKNIVKSPVVII